MSNNTTGGRSLTNQGYILAKDTLNPNQIYTMFGGTVNGVMQLVLQRKQTDGSEVIYSYYIPEPGSVPANVWADRASLAYIVTVPVGGLELPAEPGTSSGGGGGGGEVTVLNFPTDYPSEGANNHLSAISAAETAIYTNLGEPGTEETGTIPDDLTYGSGFRKMLWLIWNSITGLHAYFNSFNSYSIPSSAQSAQLVRNIADSILTVETLNNAVLNSTVFGSVDGRGFAGVIFTCISTTSSGGNVNIEVSHDGITWAAIGEYYSGDGSNFAAINLGVYGKNIVSNIRLTCNNERRFIRLRVASVTIGTSVWQMRLVSNAQINYEGTYVLAQAYGTTVIQPSAPASNGGTLPANASRIVSTAGTNATIAQTGSHSILSLTLTNTGATPAYFKIYNKNSAPAPATDSTVCVFCIPAGGSISPQMPAHGLRPGTAGLAWAITGGPAELDTTAIAAGQVTGTIIYV